MLGTLSVGFLLDDAVATQLKAITGSDIAFGMDGRILATTLPQEDRTALASLLGQPGGVHNVRIGTEDYAVLPRRLTSASDSAGGRRRAGGADSPIADRATRRVAGHPGEPGRDGDRRR